MLAAPANPDTRVLSAKSADGSETLTEIAAMSADELRAKLGLIEEKSSEPVRVATFEV